MSDDNQPGNQATPQDELEPRHVDPEFYAGINEFLELAHRQVAKHGPKRVSLVSLYFASRFNALVYLETAKGDAAAQRTGFLDYMTDLYRRALIEHLDNLGAEYGIDVGESELADEYKANGYVPGKGFVGTGDA